jgi:hypothetical protein
MYPIRSSTDFDELRAERLLTDLYFIIPILRIFLIFNFKTHCWYFRVLYYGAGVHPSQSYS